MSKLISDKDTCKIIKKKGCLTWMKEHKKEQYKVTLMGALLIKNNITSIDEVQALIDINTKILNK